MSLNFFGILIITNSLSPTKVEPISVPTKLEPNLIIGSSLVAEKTIILHFFALKVPESAL